jgi:hypothetical protein
MNSPLDLFKNIMSLGNDPQKIQEILFQRNPNLRAIYNQMLQSKMAPVEFVMQYAKQNNIPLQKNSVLNYYQQMVDMTK